MQLADLPFRVASSRTQTFIVDAVAHSIPASMAFALYIDKRVTAVQSLESAREGTCSKSKIRVDVIVSGSVPRVVGKLEHELVTLPWRHGQVSLFTNEHADNHLQAV